MRKYKVVFVDDEKDIISKIMEAVKSLIATKNGYDIEFQVLANQKSIDGMNDIAADIVLFDCALGGTDLNYEKKDESTFGVDLMKKFRVKNKRTKIIFYSGGFLMEGTQCYEFTNEEMLCFINELHIFKMIPKSVEFISESIIEAIEELDAVIISLEDLKDEYNSSGQFHIEDNSYSIEKIIEELKTGSEVGEKFRSSIFKMVLTYLMKFGGDED